MSSKPSASLCVIEGVQQSQTFPLTCRIGDICTLGRALDNTICSPEFQALAHDRVVAIQRAYTRVAG